MELYFYSPEQRKRYFGKIVAKSLQLMGGEGTADDLIEDISSLIGKSGKSVEPELKGVLRRAIRNGFLIREGKTYLFPIAKYEMDTRAKKRDRPTAKRININRVAIASRSQNKRRNAQNKSKTRSASHTRRPRSRSGSK